MSGITLTCECGTGIKFKIKKLELNLFVISEVKIIFLKLKAHMFPFYISRNVQM